MKLWAVLFCLVFVTFGCGKKKVEEDPRAKPRPNEKLDEKEQEQFDEMVLQVGRLGRVAWKRASNEPADPIMDLLRSRVQSNCSNVRNDFEKDSPFTDLHVAEINGGAQCPFNLRIEARRQPDRKSYKWQVSIVVKTTELQEALGVKSVTLGGQSRYNWRTSERRDGSLASQLSGTILPIDNRSVAYDMTWSFDAHRPRPDNDYVVVTERRQIWLTTQSKRYRLTYAKTPQDGARYKLQDERISETVYDFYFSRLGDLFSGAVMDAG